MLLQETSSSVTPLATREIHQKGRGWPLLTSTFQITSKDLWLAGPSLHQEPSLQRLQLKNSP